MRAGRSRNYVKDMKFLKLKSREVSDVLMARAGTDSLNRLHMLGNVGYTNKGSCLGQKCMMSLNDTLPVLDHDLKKYIKTFNCANIELFLRIIRCSNTLAFEELAHSIHRSSLHEKYTNILNTLPLGSASEFEYIMRYTSMNGVQIHAKSIKQLPLEPIILSVATDSQETLLRNVLDYEKWPEDHPNRIVAWLQEQGEADIAHAVSAHYTQWNVPYNSTLDKALVACDELTGFIGACCLVRPEGIHTLKPKSVKKKLKSKGFAAKVERHEVHTGPERRFESGERVLPA